MNAPLDKLHEVTAANVAAGGAITEETCVTCADPLTGRLADACPECQAILAVPERTWTTLGKELVEKVGGRETVEAAIAALEWQTIPPKGKLTVGALPGFSIKATIRELSIPKVTRIAISSFSVPGADDGDGFYPGFYGIEGNYTNGRGLIFVLDTGVSITPLVSDLYPKEG